MSMTATAQCGLPSHTPREIAIVREESHHGYEPTA